MRSVAVTLMMVQSCVVTFGQDAKPTAKVDASAIRLAAQRGVDFVEKDAAKWKQEHSCSTCHHGVMTTWVYAEAVRRGFPIEQMTVSENLEWVAQRLEKIDAPRDERPGWSMVNSPAIYLALMARAAPGPQVISPEMLPRISQHLLRHQEADGSFAWSSAPAKNRPPPFFESDEVATRLALIVLASDTRAATVEEGTAMTTAREKAAAWLKASTPTNTTQSSLLELWMRSRGGETSDSLQPDIERFLKRQRSDGGWGQLDDRPSDAYATGQSLYVLNEVGVDSKRPEIQRAITFLVSTQQEDGAWPMTRRGHPGVTPSDFKVPIIYFGSAWGTLGLLCHCPRT